MKFKLLLIPILLSSAYAVAAPGDCAKPVSGYDDGLFSGNGICVYDHQIFSETFTTVKIADDVMAKINSIDGVITSVSGVQGSVNTIANSVNGLQGSVNNLNNSVTGIQSSLNDAVMYGDASHQTVVLNSNGGGSVLENVNAGNVGNGSKQAVNGGQLWATEQNLSTAIQNNRNDITNLQTQVDTHTSQIAQNTTDITNLTTNIDNGTIGIVQHDATTGFITVGKDKNGTVVDFKGTDGDRKLASVADGLVSDQSKEAINGSQLWHTQQDFKQQLGSLDTKTNQLGQDTAAALGGSSSYDDTTGHLTAPSYHIQNIFYNNVGSALDALNTTANNHYQLITNNSTAISNLETGKTGLVRYDETTKIINIGNDKGGNELNVGGTDGNRVISGVADGDISENSSDAVTGRQLYSFGNQTAAQFNALDSKVNNNRKIASMGIASAMAMDIDMPEAELNGYAGGVGMATFDGQTAIAVGMHYLSKTGRHKFSTAFGAGLGGSSKPSAKIGWGFKM